MYNPPAFREDDLNRQHQLIRNHPLGLLISSTSDGLQASPLPFHLVSEGSSLGRLQGHLSRGNPHWRTLDGHEVLVAFQGSDAYVTPAWYRSKAEHGQVVPTWNYVMVQVRGAVQVIDDHEWLRSQITRLTHDHEARRPKPWHVTDAPAPFIDAQINGIVGLEIEIRRIEGKWKVSQNRSRSERRGRGIRGKRGRVNGASGEKVQRPRRALRSWRDSRWRCDVAPVPVNWRLIRPVCGSRRVA